MSPDEACPFCDLCGIQIGLREDTVVLLRGQFLWMAEDKFAPLMLEPETQFEVLQVESMTAAPQKALVLDPNNLGDTTIVHRACLQERFADYDENEFDIDEDDYDDIDAQMMRAISMDE